MPPARTQSVEGRLPTLGRLALIDVSSIPAPGAKFTCYIPLVQWRDFSSDFRNRTPRGVVVEHAVKSHLDPRAEVFLDSSLLDHTTAFGMSVWPPIELGGAKSPVWLMGFQLDDPQAAEGLFETFIERLKKPNGVVVVRRFRGIQIHSIETVDKDLHVARVGMTLLTASNLAALSDFLRTHLEESPPVPPDHLPLTVAWKIPPRNSRQTSPEGGLLQMLGRLGVGEVEVACERLNPGYRLRIILEGITGLPAPPQELQFDESLIDHLPEDADFILWGARTPQDEEVFLPGLPPLPVSGADRFSRSLAFGIGIPDSTDSIDQRARISGAYTKPPPPIPLELIPEEIRFATSDLALGADGSQVLKLGELELALIDEVDRRILRNTPSAETPTGLRHRLTKLARPDSNRSRPVFVGLVSSRLLSRPIDLEYEGRAESEVPTLLDLWPPLRAMVHPVDLNVFLPAPEQVEIELASTSFLSTVLVVLHSANLLQLLQKGESEPIVRWLGEMGPLPDR